MTPTPSPGQVAYETFVRVMCQPPAMRPLFVVPWLQVPLSEQAAWEAAAQAALDAQELRTGFILSRAELEHLLNCLANQKFLHEMAEPLKSEAQALIDMAWRKGMDWLAMPRAEETP